MTATEPGRPRHRWALHEPLFGAALDLVEAVEVDDGSAAAYHAIVSAEIRLRDVASAEAIAAIRERIAEVRATVDRLAAEVPRV